MPTTLANVVAKSAAGSNETVRKIAEAIPTPPTNVGDVERMLTAAAGAALVGWGLSGRETSWLAVAGGGLLLYRAASGHCGLYQAMGVNTAAGQGPATVVPAGHGVRVEHAVTVQKPADEVYRFWRNFENLPRFMTNLEAVRNLSPDGRKTHWQVKGPLGTTVEWDAEVTTDRMNETIAWRSLPGADVDNAGSVHFRPLPGGRGTEVRVELKYDPPAGKAGAAVAKLLGRDPESEIREDLQRFKSLLEAGEVATTRGQPSGRR